MKRLAIVSICFLTIMNIITIQKYYTLKKEKTFTISKDFSPVIQDKTINYQQLWFGYDKGIGFIVESKEPIVFYDSKKNQLNVRRNLIQKVFKEKEHLIIQIK